MATKNDFFRTVKLSELLITTKGRKPANVGDRSSVRELPYIDINAFENNEITSYCSPENAVLCNETDVLMVWDGSRSGLVGMGIYGALGSTLVAISIPFILPQYIYYFLLSKFDELNNNTRGMGIPHIDPVYLGEIDFPITSVSNQEILYSKIDQLYNLIDDGFTKTEKALAQISILWSLRITEALSGKLTKNWRDSNSQGKPLPVDIISINNQLEETLPVLPSDWRYVKLSSVIESISYGTSKKCTYEPQETGVIRIPNIVNGEICDNDLKFANFTEKEKDKYSLKEDDILIIRSNGSLNLVGACARVKSKDTGYLFAGYLLRLRINLELVNPSYLKYALESPLLRKQIERIAKSSSGVNNINAEEIRSLIIPICSIEEQLVIVNELENIKYNLEAQQVQLRNLLEKSELTKKEIVKDAFSIGFKEMEVVGDELDDYITDIKLKKEKMLVAKKKNRSKKPRAGKMNNDHSLLDILKDAGKTLTVKELFANSKYNNEISSETVEAFYLELKELSNNKDIAIEEIRDGNTKIEDVITFRG